MKKFYLIYLIGFLSGNLLNSKVYDYPNCPANWMDNRITPFCAVSKEECEELVKNWPSGNACFLAENMSDLRYNDFCDNKLRSICQIIK